MDPQERQEIEAEFGPDIERLRQEAQELGIDMDIDSFLGLEGGDSDNMGETN